MVEAGAIVDGTAIRESDLLVGIPSDGFHTNGYSLIRAALGLNDSDATRMRLGQPAPFDRSRSLAEVLLQPHRSYRADVRAALATGSVRGMAHITGGGLPGNVSRIVPDGLVAEVDRNAWDVPAMFQYVAETGHVDEDECYRAFNMGIGFVLVIPENDVDRVLESVGGSAVIGRVRSAIDGDGDQRVRLLERQTGRG
jgi:phosphoribosylformylglycinamidine cyclo-ligase